MGMNAIAIYMVSEVLDGMLHTIHLSSGVSAHVWIYDHLFAPLASPMNASLLYAVTYTLLMYLVAYGMYRAAGSGAFESHVILKT